MNQNETLSSAAAAKPVYPMGRRRLQLPTSALRHYDTGAFDEVGETGEATPYYCRPWRRVGNAVEITPEACDRLYIEVKVVWLLPLSVRGREFEHAALGLGRGTVS
jgi:hypothetical protein